MDPFHSLDSLKNQYASVTFCRNLEVCYDQNAAVRELPVVVSINEFPCHL